MGDAFYALDGAWRITYANKRALDFWQTSLEAVYGRVLWDCFPALHGTRNAEVIRRAQAERRVLTFEAPSPVNGVWVRANVGPFKDGVTVYWRDISERRRAEETLRASEAHLRLAQDAAGIGTWDWDLETDRIHWSSQMYVLMGRPEAEGRTDDPYGLWLEMLHPDDRSSADAAARAASRVVAPFGFEFRIRRPDGAVRWLLTRGNVLPNAADEPGRMVGINIDITDQKRAEEALERRVAQRTQALRDTVGALQRSRERNAAIFANAPVDLAFLGVMEDGRIRIEDVNPAWIRNTGYAREAVVGRLLEEALSPEHAAMTLDYCRRAIEQRGRIEYEYTTMLGAGESTRRCFLVPLLDEDAGVRNILLTAVDLTEMRRIEAQLRQAQKMEAIGQLTGGIAHDFNNLLTAILGNLEMLQATAPDERAARRVASAMRAARRGGELTQQLLAYARRQNLSPQAVDANLVISGMAELLQRSLGGLVQVEMTLAPDLWASRSDPTQLELMLLNLAINARDAMPQGGSIRISTANMSAWEPALPAELVRGEYVVIRVADDGSGMPPEVLEHAFEPFFTTKDVGKGSGLGLAQVYGLAAQFGGTARLQSRLGAGTTVEVFLPRADAPAPVEPGDAVPAEKAGPHWGTVLVVDDERDVRAIAAEILREAGYTVREAADGPAALKLLGDGRVSVLLVDYAMPVMSGAELARQARLSHPRLPIVYVTGTTETLAPTLLNPADAVVTKPYASAALLRAVRAAMRR
ncbi:MAG: hypothetical protein BGO51_01705 [Rhodospirillales bacterium 69-11]|nr:PAS domain S-box protein [Rhodospirillales bacterium]OJW25324.1 MAG: hypothetical protein BGO51_01705 [Rhodospirillales bacterium 69-11]